MNKKTIVAVLAGLAAFALPFLLPLETLPYAGRITMGIFLLAALFWVLEPIPIYATSMVVIFLLILLLSAQGPLLMFSSPSTIEAVKLDSGEWALPASSLNREAGKVYLLQEDEFQALPIEWETDGDTVRFSFPESEIESGLFALNGNHWTLTYSAPSYTSYLNTLASPIIILFLGGFVLAAGAVKYRLDRNLIRIIIIPFGNRPGSIVFGLMLVTALLSGFMSNTATTAMMMAVILPILSGVPEGDRFRIGLALCIPFAANIGGISTPIGTPPNAIALNALAERGVSIPFTSWILLTIPLVALLLVITWLLIMKFFPCKEKILQLNLKDRFERSPQALCLYIIFGLTVFLWITEAVHGIGSAMIAFMPVALLPALGVIHKDDIRKLPWEVLWLMAGGIALGAAMRETGMAAWLVEIVPWGAMGVLGILAAFGVVAILMATFIANTVAATLLMPLVMSLVSSGIAEGFSIETAALTIAVGASLGMSLPISTPPNAIAMSTGLIRTIDMARMGVLLGLIGYALLLLMATLVWTHIF